jgi:hypothetical protein
LGFGISDLGLEKAIEPAGLAAVFHVKHSCATPAGQSNHAFHVKQGIGGD